MADYKLPMKTPILLSSLLMACVASPLRADISVAFNEIMYHPATNEPAMEWVEVRNQMSVDVDLTGWSIAGGIQFNFPPNTVMRGGRLLVIAVSPATLMAATGATNVLGPFTGRLGNNGEPLQLLNNNRRVVDEVSYGADGDWPVAPDGAGMSLAKIERDSASGPARNWTWSEEIGGTPGADNFPLAGAVPTNTQLFPMETAWTYEASGAEPGAGWRLSSFDDGAWASGQAWFYHGAITVGETRRIPTLFSSGVGTNGAVVNVNTRDPHYFTVFAAQGVANTNSLVILNNPAWMANDTESRWLGVATGTANVAAGRYNFLTRFSLTGFLPETARLSLGLAADDRCTNVFLNGVAKDISFVGFAAFSTFTLTNGFVEGTNTLEFRTLNDGTAANPGGFRASLSGTAQVVITNTAIAAVPKTHYFRKAFTFTGDPEKTVLRLNTIVDDGAIFHLNGVEVFRVNLPDGPVSYATPALANVATPGYTGLVPISTASLVPGLNVLAVEMHQAADGAEDALFGAELVATPFQPAPVPLAFNELSEAANNAFALELVNYGTNNLLLDGVVIYRDGAANSEYAFPPGQSLGPNGYLSLKHTALGFLPVAGDRLYLFGPGKKRVYDGAVVKATAQGRSPAGTGPWLRPNAPTPAAANSFAFRNEIVINEIMYHHQALPGVDGAPPQASPEQWIELYNRSSDTVPLTGWELAGGISYQFLTGQNIAPGGYLVVARDVAAMRAQYPGVEVVGDFRGRLSSRGESIILRDPVGNPADEVRYFDKGSWPRYADGGGSSLELRDPQADNSKAETWAASDETAKAPWQTYSYRLVASVTGGQPSNWNDFVFGLLDQGECLIDDISVIESPTTTPVQFLSNGNFDNGLAGWRLVGDHNYSRLDVDPDNPGNQVLRLVARGPQEHMNNHLERTYNSGRAVVNNRLYEISFRAKWLAGNNLLNTRLYFNRVARSSALPTPARSGTPGARNSRYEPNLGPTFSQFQHQPVAPKPSEPVTVSVVAQDPQGIGACDLWWSAAGGAWNTAPMTHHGGGVYRGAIPGYGSGTVVQFYARATDGLGAAATYPAAGPNSGALYKVADGQANLNIAHNIRIILSPANTALLHAFTNVMSNDNLPCTVVYDENRAYYDMTVRLKGSQRGRYSDTRVSFHLNFNPDDLFKGVHPVMLVDRSGAGDSADNKQQEILIRHIMLRAGGIPMIHTDICRVLAPIATHTGPAMFAPRYEDQFLDTAFENGADGTLWELELIYYPTSANPAGYKQPQPDEVVGTDISDLGDSKEAYRYNFIIKNHRDADDYSPFMAMAKTWSLTGAALDARSRQIMDVSEWLRAWAGVTLCGVGDTYTFGNNHNLIMYLRPSDRKMMAFPWDMDFSFNRGTGDPLVGDQNFSKIISLPANLRLFYAHILDIIGSSYNTNYMAYWVNRYDDFCPGQNFSPVVSYINARANSARSTINSAAGGGTSPFAVTGTNVITTSANLVALSGTAPVHINTIEINGIVYPIVWTTVSKWTISVPVSAATNVLTLAGFDLYDRPVTNLGPTVTVRYTGPPPTPQGAVVINEIMYHPATLSAAYVELFNTSPDQSFDLSGWRVSGIDYTFPPGSVLTNRQFLVLAKDPIAYLLAYTNAPAPFAQFNGTLQPEGETLTLLQPGANPGEEIVVDRVRYESAPPWPATPNGQGAALQLLLGRNTEPSLDLLKVKNLRAEGGGSLISGLGISWGVPIPVNIELSLNPLSNHSIIPLTDSLAFQELLASIDGSVSVDEANKIERAMSSKMPDSLERGVATIYKLFKGTSISISIGDRDAYYVKLFEAKSTIERRCPGRS